MKLSDFINRLIKIQNEYSCDDAEISMMSEHQVDLQTIQFNSVVKDVAAVVSKNNSEHMEIPCEVDLVKGIVVIGQELD